MDTGQDQRGLSIPLLSTFTNYFNKNTSSNYNKLNQTSDDNNNDTNINNKFYFNYQRYLLSTTNSSSFSFLYQYKDIFFYFLYILNNLIILSIALSYGNISLLSKGAKYFSYGINIYEEISENENLNMKLFLTFIYILTLSILLPLNFIYIFSYLNYHFIYRILILLFFFSLVFLFFFLFFSYYNFFIVVFILDFLLLLIVFYYYNFIDFIIINLNIASKFLYKTKKIFVMLFFLLIFYFIYFFIWSIAFLGYATNRSNVIKTYNNVDYYIDDCSTYQYSSSLILNDDINLTCTNTKSSCYACICGEENVLVSSTSPCFRQKYYFLHLCFLIISLFWTNAIFANVIHCVISSSVYQYWQYNVCEEEMIEDSLKEFTTVSFGSICFGSLIAAWIRFFRTFFYFLNTYMRRFSTTSSSSSSLNYNNFSFNLTQLLNNFLKYCIQFVYYFFILFDKLFLYFNQYTYSFIAIDKLDYISAAKASIHLFKSKSIMSVINNDIIDLILLIFAVILSVINIFFVKLYNNYIRLPKSSLYLVMLYTFFCTFVSSSIIFSSISSSVTAIYICFLKKIQGFPQHEPTQYYALVHAWNKMAPGIRDEEDNHVEMNKSKTGTGDQRNGEGYDGNSSEYPHQYDMNKENDTLFHEYPTSVQGSYNPPTSPQFQHVSPPFNSLSSSGTSSTKDSFYKDGQESRFVGYHQEQTAPVPISVPALTPAPVPVPAPPSTAYFNPSNSSQPPHAYIQPTNYYPQPIPSANYKVINPINGQYENLSIQEDVQDYKEEKSFMDVIKIVTNTLKNEIINPNSTSLSQHSSQYSQTPLSNSQFLANSSQYSQSRNSFYPLNNSQLLTNSQFEQQQMYPTSPAPYYQQQLQPSNQNINYISSAPGQIINPVPFLSNSSNNSLNSPSNISTSSLIPSSSMTSNLPPPPPAPSINIDEDIELEDDDH